jgi:tetratricopeptide (TPR) repeat protein
VARIQGRLKDSLKLYRCALAYFSRSQDRFGLAYALCGMGNALRRLGRGEEALRHYMAARALYKALGDPVDLAYVDWGIGRLDLGRKRIWAAVLRLHLALRQFRAFRERRGEILCLVALSDVKLLEGKAVIAKRLRRRAASLARRFSLQAHRERFA